MTLDKAKEMLLTQVGFGGGYNRNGTKLILIEVQRDHGMGAYDQLIKEHEIVTHFGFKQGEVKDISLLMLKLGTDTKTRPIPTS